jgi:hypothetical protein
MMQQTVVAGVADAVPVRIRLIDQRAMAVTRLNLDAFRVDTGAVVYTGTIVAVVADPVIIGILDGDIIANGTFTHTVSGEAKIVATAPSVWIQLGGAFHIEAARHLPTFTGVFALVSRFGFLHLKAEGSGEGDD